MSGPAAQGLGRIRALLDRHGVRPRRALGQNFLADPNVVDRIVRTAAIDDGARVVEVGTGTGSLTIALAATGAAVVTYEVDERLRGLLDAVLGGFTNVDLRFADALSVDLESDLGGGEWVMVANLPYNVGTPVLVEALRSAPRISRFVVMLQKEVADRLVAVPGSKEYGLPTVSVALRAVVKRAFNVGPQVFLPRPEVESSVIVVERASVDALADAAEAMAAAAFNQRRKMLRRSLVGTVVDPVRVIEGAGLDPEARAEDLSADDYIRLAAAVGR